MNNYNSELIFNDSSLVFLDPKTKGYKTLQDILSKKNVKWTNVIEKDVTHAVCTRYACNQLHVYESINSKGNHHYVYGINDGELDRNWNLLKDKKIYSYNEFLYLLDNPKRVESEYSDKILELLKTCDESNITLAITMMDNYIVDPRWIPWLKMNTWIADVRKYLRKINVDFHINNSTDNLRNNLKWRIEDLIRGFDVPKEYRLDFLKDLLDE